MIILTYRMLLLAIALCFCVVARANDAEIAFFESKIRPVLVQHCYECHSEQAKSREGGLLLDRRSGWLEGGDTAKAIVPGDLEASLLIAAIRYENDDLQMPPDGKLSGETIELLEKWILRGAPGPKSDMGQTEFSRLGDQEYLFQQAADHWAFQPVAAKSPPETSIGAYQSHPVDRFIASRLEEAGIRPSPQAEADVLAKRLYFSLVGLPPTTQQIREFAVRYESDSQAAVGRLVDQLLNSPQYGQHMARLWLDVARYADTDSTYRPDTKTPYYFPFAFTYRDYVVTSLNEDKSYARFIKEQFAADLMGYGEGDPEMAALGFLGMGPHANRSQAEALDDWIDVTTQGLMGLTVACARCHDHKYEPVPTADYYSLRGVFAGILRPQEYDRKNQPKVSGYSSKEADVRDFEKQLAEIEQRISEAGNKKAKNNNRTIAKKIRDTELAKLLTFHPGAPAHAMVVRDKKRIPRSYIFLRGDQSSPGAEVPRRFVRILDPQQPEFSSSGSGRLELAEKIASPDNPMTARIMVNRVWGYLMGSHLVATPSDFGLQGAKPTHPDLLDYLADDFIKHGWSIKHLVRQIATSRVFLQQSRQREASAEVDPQNSLYWRANRKHFSIEMLRDRLLACSGQLDLKAGGHAGQLWKAGYTKRRAIYGFVNRFNLDPTLRAFDFPTPMQTSASRGESIVASQALFTLNSQFVSDQAIHLVNGDKFLSAESARAKIEVLFDLILLRRPVENEILKIEKFASGVSRLKKSARFVDDPWQLVAQSLMMTNEFQYVD